MLFRSGKGEHREPGVLPADYGYVRKTDGKDDAQIDAFVGNDFDAGKIFIVDSYDEDGEFDEHKLFFAYPSEEVVRKHFQSYYYNRSPIISEVAHNSLREWFASGDTHKPYAQMNDTEYTAHAIQARETCSQCEYYVDSNSVCVNKLVKLDPKVPTALDGAKIVSPAGWCKEFSEA